MLSLRQLAVTSVKWTTVSTTVSVALQFLQYGVLARLLEPSAFGLMAMVVAVTGFAQIFGDVGISNAVIHRQDATSKQLSSLYWLNLFAGVAVMFFVWASAPLVAIVFREPRLVELLWWMGTTFVVAAIGQQFQYLYQRELRFDLLSKIETSSVLVGTIVAIGTAFNGAGVFSLVWGQLASSGLKSFLLAWSGWGEWPPALHCGYKEVREFVRFGVYQMASRSLGYFNSRLDQVLIGFFGGAEILGYYALASNLVATPITKLSPIITRVIFPLLAKVQNDQARLQRGYFSGLRAVTLLSAPILLGIAAVAPTAVPLVFGQQWLVITPLIQVLSLVALLRSISSPVGSLVLAKGRPDIEFQVSALVLVTQIPGVYVGVRLGGAMGVAYSLLALQCLYSVYTYRFAVSRLLGPCLRPYCVSVALPLFVAGVMAGIVGVVERTLRPGTGFGTLAVEIFLGGTVFVILVMVFMHREVVSWRSLLTTHGLPTDAASRAS